jgi:hypothetical protein
MATYVTSTVANTEGFIPSIWAQEALPILRANLNLAKYVAKDSDFGEGAFATVGQTLNIGYAGTFATQDKTANTLLTASVPTGGTSKSVTLDHYKVVPFVIENIAQAQSNQNLMQRLLEPAVVALAEQVETDLFGLYTSLTATALGTAGTDLTAADIRSARKVLNDAKAPQTDRHLFVSDKDEIALLGDSALSTYYAYAQAQAIETGTPPKLYGFNVHQSQLVPATGSSPVATHNIAIHKNAFVLATRPIRPAGGSTVMSAMIQDEQSGLTLNMEAQYNIQAMGLWVNLSILYGLAALRPDQGVELTA